MCRMICLCCHLTRGEAGVGPFGVLSRMRNVVEHPSRRQGGSIDGENVKIVLL